MGRIEAPIIVKYVIEIVFWIPVDDGEDFHSVSD
jgi:hypothetical protein